MGSRVARWAMVSAAVMGVVTATSCTMILGINGNYHKDKESEGAGGGCAEEGACATPCTGDADPLCGEYACSNGVCLTRCSSDADCNAAATCVGVACASRKELGAPCDADTECTSRICRNRICCSSPCGTCQVCDSVTYACKNIPADEFDAINCPSPSACDGNGVCLLGPGQACASASECRATLSCADGVCCGSACTEICRSCKLPGLEGMCSVINADQLDTNPVCGGAMDMTRACNGFGSCALVKGQPCTKSSDCVSGSCAGTPLICQ